MLAYLDYTQNTLSFIYNRFGTLKMTGSCTETGTLVHCYNKGCGKQFDPAKNPSDSCQHHPGVPVFHDALKGWSCCNKKSTDFSEFLSIPGCTKSPHSDQKAQEQENVPTSQETTTQNGRTPQLVKMSEEEKMERRKPVEQTPRPSKDEPLVEMERTVAASLTQALAKIMQEKKKADEELKATATTTVSDGDGLQKQLIQIPLGTPCKNAACQTRYEDENTNKKPCQYHTGVAVFHEGMKYWSCCQRKTSDFETFLNQGGCIEGSHLWFKPEPISDRVDCRFDFHQHGGFAILTVYAKNANPEKCTIKANKIRVEMEICFEDKGSKLFDKQFELFGVVDLSQSQVNFFQTKVEVKLKKQDPISWTKLEIN